MKEDAYESCGVIGMGSEDDVERGAVAHQKNLNPKVDVDAGCIF
jgi:hypothetical protein